MKNIFNYTLPILFLSIFLVSSSKATTPIDVCAGNLKTKEDADKHCEAVCENPPPSIKKFVSTGYWGHRGHNGPWALGDKAIATCQKQNLPGNATCACTFRVTPMKEDICAGNIKNNEIALTTCPKVCENTKKATDGGDIIGQWVTHDWHSGDDVAKQCNGNRSMCKCQFGELPFL